MREARPGCERGSRPGRACVVAQASRERSASQPRASGTTTHAVSAIAEGPRLRVLSPGWGEPASFFVLQELEPWVVDPCQRHAWVGSALGLGAYPIIYRDWQRPLSGTFFGPAYRLFGGERDLRATYGPPEAYPR